MFRNRYTHTWQKRWPSPKYATLVDWHPNVPIKPTQQFIFSVLSPRKVLWPIYPERSYGPHLSYRNAAGIYSCIGFLVMKAPAAMNVLTPLQKKLLLL